MHIAIVGPGALGCLFAAKIVMNTDHTVSLLDHDANRADFLADRGLRLYEGENEFCCPLQVSCSPSIISEADLCLLCVKSYNVSFALRSITPYLQTDCILISFQNGISHHDVMDKMNSICNTALGVTAQGATLIEPGVVRHAGNGPTKIGLCGQDRAAETMLRKAGALFSEADMPNEIIDDIIPHIWAKLFVNIGINALTAIYDCPNGGLLDLPEAMRRMERAVREAQKVARYKGIALLADPLETTLQVCRATSENISSMLQDVRRKRHTEIESINGAIVQAAQTFGIDTPENESLLREVQDMEKCYSSLT